MIAGRGAARLLLEGLIDYAGLFPPASLALEPAVRAYASFRCGAEAWMLGRFVVPVARLDALGEMLAGLGEPDAPGPWRLSALGGESPGEDARRIEAFHAARGHLAVVDACEIRPPSLQVLAEIADSLGGLDVYVETAADEGLADWLAAIREVGARAKIRTGGVTPELIPPCRDVARFLASCADAGLAFKATAGLHHPVRSVRPLTYEDGAPAGKMHGFLNLFLAAVLVRAGRLSEEETVALLEEESPGAFRFDESGAAWRSRRVGWEDVRQARRSFAISFGSCSFEEPVQDLKELSLL